MNLGPRLARIRLLLMDCDGVLTDGRLYYSANGEAFKVFNVRDGQGIAEWHRRGFLSGIVTGRGKDLLEGRAKELGIEFLRAVSNNKADDAAAIMNQAGVKPDETAFIGDDIPDIAAMRAVGFGFAVADAAEAVLGSADLVTTSRGGCGAVREVIDLILDAKSAYLSDDQPDR